MKDILTERELKEMFNEYLDEVWGTVEIAGFGYATSAVLKDADPIAYKCMFNDWLDAEVSAGVIDESEGEYRLA
jgi:hypothetical protein